MSEYETNSKERDSGELRDSCPHRGERDRKLRLGIAAGILLSVGMLVGGLISTAIDASAFGGAETGHERGHGARHARMLERMQDKVSWMLTTVDATPEQQSEVEGIVSATIERMRSFHQDRREGRREFMAELLRSEINRDTLEQLRQRHIAGMDQMSAVVVEGAVRAAGVLTPEQRQQLLESRPLRR